MKEDKHRGWLPVAISAFLLLLPVAYVLSVGPVFWLAGTSISDEVDI